jgi:hypothetical protein
LGGREGGR